MSGPSDIQPNGFRPPTDEEISRCAYHIYVAEGCPEGKSSEHWFEAERQLTIGALHDAVVPPARANPESSAQTG